MPSLLHFLKLVLWMTAACVSALPASVQAGEEDDARSAVEEIRTTISKQEFELLWDSHLSEVFKGGVRKADFLQNMRQGRAHVGLARAVTPMSYTFAEFDPTTGYRGKIYSFDFHVKYERGAFLERLVVVKDPDGRYRLAGIWANPAPQ